MLILDGSAGEGGGQILRTALGLSMVTGTPFRIERIRARRPRPGLLRQHLCAAQAAAAVSGADMEGASLGSTALTFRPGALRPGDHAFAVGTAGSATLVLQAVLPALVGAQAPSRLVLEGGTHNPFAPPFEFLERAFLPLLARMGPRVTVRLERAGFYPAGGGRFVVEVTPSALTPLELYERGAVRAIHAQVLLANLGRRIAEREAAVLAAGLEIDQRDVALHTGVASPGPGNAVLVEVECEHLREVFVGFGEKGVSAEAVAANVVRDVRAYLLAGAPVGAHLADQLLVPLAMAGAGCFRTVTPTQHTRTNLETVRRFLDVSLELTEASDGTALMRVG